VKVCIKRLTILHGVPVVLPTNDRVIPGSTPGTFDTNLHGAPVILPTNDREIPGSTAGRYNLHVKITSCSVSTSDTRLRKTCGVCLLESNEKLLGILRMSNPTTRKDFATRTWGCSGTNPNNT